MPEGAIPCLRGPTPDLRGSIQPTHGTERAHPRSERAHCRLESEVLGPYFILRATLAIVYVPKQAEEGPFGAQSLQ